MKKGLRKTLVLILVFIAAAAAVFFITRGEEEEETIYDGMTEASLPVVYTLYNGEEINRLYGYTESMKEEYMRENMTPLDYDGQMSISVDCYKNIFLGLKYEVRDADSGRLIDATYGRRTRAVLMMDSDHVILSAIQPETVAGRLSGGEEDV